LLTRQAGALFDAYDRRGVDRDLLWSLSYLSIGGRTTIEGRVHAEREEPFVVFLIGMRVNKLWAVHRWLPILLVATRMVRELRAREDSELLRSRSRTCAPTPGTPTRSISTRGNPTTWRRRPTGPSASARAASVPRCLVGSVARTGTSRPRPRTDG